jgi:hypothetical protein
MSKLLEKNSALREKRLSSSSKHEISFFGLSFSFIHSYRILRILFLLLGGFCSVVQVPVTSVKVNSFFFFRVMGDFEQLLNFEEICSNLGDR